MGVVEVGTMIDGRLLARSSTEDFRTPSIPRKISKALPLSKALTDGYQNG